MTPTTLKPDEILRRAHAVASYYGFASFAHVASKNKDKKKVEGYPDSLSLETLDPMAREVAGFLKQVRDSGVGPSVIRPLFVWHSNATPGRPAPRSVVIQFHALGVERAIADAVLLRAVRSLVSELGKEEPTIRINSMGDKETRGRFSRELGQFFKKHGAVLPADCVSCARRDLLEAIELMEEGELRDSVPSPTDHLSEQSRKHFETVLEYLESTDTPFELAPELLSRGGSWTETCFEVTGNEQVRAWGSRYGELARHFFKEPLPSIGAVIKLVTTNKDVMPSLRERTTPRFVFVHIGDEAKRESIKMADTLRRARISLSQSIGIESLTEQMRLAENLNPPFLLIMGRKEALERSVILRERSTHTESVIGFDDLVKELRAVA